MFLHVVCIELLFRYLFYLAICILALDAFLSSSIAPFSQPLCKQGICTLSTLLLTLPIQWMILHSCCAELEKKKLVVFGLKNIKHTKVNHTE